MHLGARLKGNPGSRVFTHNTDKRFREKGFLLDAKFGAVNTRLTKGLLCFNYTVCQRCGNRIRRLHANEISGNFYEFGYAGRVGRISVRRRRCRGSVA